MPRKYGIGLSSGDRDLSRAIRELRRLERKMRTATDDIALQLANEGARMAEALFNTSGVTVSVVKRPGGYTIDANGKGICFLEFGAGDHAGFGYNTASISPANLPPIGPGTWSDLDKRQYSTYGYWKFGGMTYHTVYPRRAMYQASIQIANDLLAKAKEYFK